jgi:predicted nucleic acid-binding protein
VTVAVLDASAAVAALVEATPRGDGVRRRIRQASNLAAPAHFTAEVANALLGLALGGHLTELQLAAAIADLASMPVDQYSASGALLQRAIELRRNANVYDALYLALAEQLNCSVVTIDIKLAATPAVRCVVEVVGPS